MEIKHWVFLVIIFIVGYFVGSKFPGGVGAIKGTIQSVSP